MERVAIKDFYGRIIGWIETDLNTGNKTARDYYQRILGYYDQKDNVTRDYYQRIIARGDMLSMLIQNAENEYQNKNK